jgi:hypothetical protein
MVEALQFPSGKKFHRFFPMTKKIFILQVRTEAYTVIEVSMFEGRTVDAKKQLLKLLFERLNR